MSSMQSIIRAFNSDSSTQDICLIYDNGEALDSIIKVSYRQVYVFSQEIYTALAKHHKRAKEIIGLFFNSDFSTILGIVPAIIAILRLNCVFIVFDRKAQSWPWIEDVIINLNIRNIVTDSGRDFANNLDNQAKFMRRTKIRVKKIVTSQEPMDLNLSLVEIISSERVNEATTSLEKIQNWQNLVYIVQTSGTTTAFEETNSRLIFVPEQSIMPNIYDFYKEFRVRKGSLMFAASPPTFDPFYVDLFLAFYTKSTLLFVPQSSKFQSTRLFDIIERQMVNFMQITPTLYKILRKNLEIMLISASNPLDILVIGGETFPDIPYKILLETLTVIYNVYGVTEMSCWQTCIKVNGNFKLDPKRIFSIDVPPILSETSIELCEFSSNKEDYPNIQNCEKYGEIIVSSSTRKCGQMINGVLVEVGQKNYRVRTGDIGYLTNGSIYIANRMATTDTEDLEQVMNLKNESHFKINGMRITLPVIENALENICKYKCYCIRHYMKNIQSHTIIVFVLNPDFIDQKQDEELLLQKELYLFKLWVSNLPSHYIPQRIFFLSTIPMTLNGKFDKKFLSKQIELSPLHKPCLLNDHLSNKKITMILNYMWCKYTPAHTASQVEEQCWQFMPPLSSQFVLDGGGDSILALQFIDELESRVGDVRYRLPIETLLNKTFGDILEWLKSQIGRQTNTDTVDITKQNDINGIEKIERNLSPRTIDTSIQMNFLDSILIATKGCPFTYSVSNNSKDNILLNPKAGISTLSMKELWNIDLIKCVDASPVVVLHDVNNLRSRPISTNHRNDVQEPKYNATVYIGSHSGLFVAVNLNDGRVIWKTQLAGIY